jgi:hypothetical protein
MRKFEIDCTAHNCYFCYHAAAFAALVLLDASTLCHDDIVGESII